MKFTTNFLDNWDLLLSEMEKNKPNIIRVKTFLNNLINEVNK